MCLQVRLALTGEGGAGGLDDGLRTVENHLSAILGMEEAHAALAGEAGADAGGDPGPNPDHADAGAAAAVEAALADVARARGALADAGAKVLSSCIGGRSGLGRFFPMVWRCKSAPFSGMCGLHADFT